MALLQRRRTTDAERVEEERVEAERVDRDRAARGMRHERAGAAPGLVRALFTLAGVGAAGLLIWIASTLDRQSTGEFWVVMALLAGAGLALGLSQLFGGWTKWGWPTLSPIVFLLGFLPTLVVGGWIILATQPEGGWQQSRFEGWSDDLGILGFVEDFQPFLPAVALIVGLVLAFSFDTTGPRTRVVGRERGVSGEDVAEYRRRETTTTAAPTTPDRTVAEDLRTREEGAETAPAGARTERLERREPERRDTL